MAQPPYGSPAPHGSPAPYGGQPPIAPLPSYTPQAGVNAAAIAPSGEPDINQPWYGIGFVPALIRPFKKYASFNGRASRGEYWWFELGVCIVVVVLYVLMLTAGVNWNASPYSSSLPLNGFGVFLEIVMVLFGLAIIVPTLALTWRRLHDTNRSGVWWLISFIPFVGSIILLVLMASPTYQGPTQWDQPGAAFGPQPGYAPPMAATPYAYQPAPPLVAPPAAPPVAGYQPYQTPAAPPQAPSYGMPPTYPGANGQS